MTHHAVMSCVVESGPARFGEVYYLRTPTESIAANHPTLSPNSPNPAVASPDDTATGVDAAT